MTLKRARPLDEAIEIAGEDYDDFGGREERIERRKKRRAKRKSSRARRLKKDSSRLRREARVTTSSRSSSRRKKRSSASKSPQRTRSEARSSQRSDPQYEEEAFVPYDDYDEGYDDPATYDDDDYEEAWPEEDYDPEDFEDPYEDYLEDDYDDEFEGDFAGKSKKKGLFARRKARAKTKAHLKDWEKPALVGKLRIHAKKGHRAAIRELESGIYLVAEVAPGQMENLQRLREAELAGDGDPELGALSLIAKLASLRAQRLLNKEAAPQAAPMPMVPAPMPMTPSVEPAHPWYDKSKVPPGVGGAVVTQPGDTMWGIASKHLGNGLRWNQVYLVNASQLQGKKPTDALSPGLVLWLPVAPTGNWLSS
jgi:nucleoid-associated protein YgaU